MFCVYFPHSFQTTWRLRLSWKRGQCRACMLPVVLVLHKERVYKTDCTVLSKSMCRLARGAIYLGEKRMMVLWVKVFRKKLVTATWHHYICQLPHQGQPPHTSGLYSDWCSAVFCSAAVPCFSHLLVVIVVLHCNYGTHEGTLQGNHGSTIIVKEAGRHTKEITEFGRCEANTEESLCAFQRGKQWWDAITETLVWLSSACECSNVMDTLHLEHFKMFTDLE